MKKILPSLLVAILATAAYADLTITQKIQSEAQPSADMTVNMKIKGQKMRMDVGPKMSTIVDLQSGDMQSLMHEQKVVMTIPGALMKSMQAQAQTAGGETADVAPKPTGNKETISGFACEEYEMTSNGAKVHVWVTQDLPAAEKIMKEVSSLSPETDPLKGALKDQKLPGFPMRTIIEMPNAGKTTMTVVALSENPLSDKDFVVPSGYKAMQMPTLPR